MFVLFLSCTGQFWQNKEELCERVFAHSLEADTHMGVLGHKFTLLHHSFVHGYGKSVATNKTSFDQDGAKLYYLVKQ